MYHKLYKVMEFEIVSDDTLLVLFDGDTRQVIDFEPVLHGEMWGPLRDLASSIKSRLTPSPVL